MHKTNIFVYVIDRINLYYIGYPYLICYFNINIFYVKDNRKDE